MGSAGLDVSAGRERAVKYLRELWETRRWGWRKWALWHFVYRPSTPFCPFTRGLVYVLIFLYGYALGQEIGRAL